MKIKTAELTGVALDWAVAKCENVEFDEVNEPIWFNCNDYRVRYTPSTDWAQGGVIIERERINLQWIDGVCEADVSADCYGVGNTPLIAAMRCYVASKLGDEVDVPDNL